MNDNGQSYFFQTQSDTLFVNDDTNTVGVNVEVTPYDLEVKDTVRTSNLLADNVSACNLLQGLTINAQSNLCWGGHSLYEPYPQDQTDWDDLIPFTGDDEGMIHHSWIRKPLSGKDVLTDLWNLADAGFDVAETIADAIQFFQGASNALTQGAINAIQELLDNALENSNQSLSINWANLRDKPIARSGYKVGMNGDLLFSSNASLKVLNSGYITDQWNNLNFVGNNPTGATLIDFGNRQAYFKDITLSNNEGRNTLYTVDEIVTDSNFKIGDIRFYQSNINNSASNISINGVQMLENDLTLSVVKADQMNAFSYYDPTGTGASLGFFGSETTLRHIRTPLASNIADRVYLTLRLKDSEMSFEKLSACNTKTILFQVNSNGEFYTYSNLRTNAPFTIRAIANSIDDYPREGLTFLTENNFRYIRRRVVLGSNEDTISASFSSNGLLLGERASLFGKVESVILNPLLSNAITKYPRLEYSFSNGLTYGYGFSNHPLNGDFDIFKVSYKGEITTLNHQNFLMKQILNSNADLTTNLLVNDRISLSSNGLTISNLAVNSNGSMTFANMPFLTEAGALIRRAFADPASNQGFSVSPTGFVNVNATNFQITNEGQLSTRMPITASNINTSNLTATSNLVALSNMTIGTTTPTERLTLQGGNIAIRNATVNNANGHNHGGIVWYGLNRTTGNASAKILSTSTAWDDAGDLRFITSDGADDGFERMCIAQAGNVGIGTTSPSTLLDVNGRTTLRTDVSLMSNNSTWGNSAGRQLYMRYSTNGTQDASYIQSIDRSVGTYYNMALEGSNIALGGLNSLTNPQVYIQTTLGRVGINTTNPVYNLDVNSNFNATTINEFGVPLINKYALSNALSNVSSNLTTFSNWSSCNFVGLSNAFSNTQSNFATYSNNIQASISSLSNWTDATFRKKSVNVPWSEISGKPNFTSDSNGDALSIGGLVLGSAGLLFGGTALLNQNGQLTSALQNVAGSLKLNPSGYSRFDDGIQLLDKISIDPSGAISAVTGSFKYSQFTDAVKIGTLSLTLSNDQIIWTSNTTSNAILSSNALVVRNNQPFTFSNANMIFTCNIGVGTTTPLEQIEATTAIRSPIFLSANPGHYYGNGWKFVGGAWSNYTSQGGYVLRNGGTGECFQVWTGSNALTQQLTVLSTGNVGIGTNAPVQKLDVNGGMRTSSNALINNSVIVGDVGFGSGFAGLCHSSLSNTSSNNYGFIQASDGNTFLNASSNRQIFMRLGNIDQAYINSNGFGIGTTAPQAKFHIISSTGSNVVVARFQGGGGAGNSYHIDLASYVSGTTGLPTARMTLFDENFSSHIIFSSKNTGADSNPLTERMRIKPDGNVGIGTNNPQYRLDVAGDARCSNLTMGLSNVFARLNVALSGSPAVGGYYAWFGWSNEVVRVAVVDETAIGSKPGGLMTFGNAGLGLYGKGGPVRFFNYTDSETMRINNAGSVGIGTTNPSFTLDVVGTINSSQLLYEGGNALLTKYALSNTVNNLQTQTNWTSNALSNYTPINLGVFSSNTAQWTSNNYVALSNTYYSTSNNFADKYWTFSNSLVTTNSNVSISNLLITANEIKHISSPSNTGLSFDNNGSAFVRVGTGRFFDIQNQNNDILGRVIDGAFGFFSFRRDVIASCNLAVGGVTNISACNYLEFGTGVANKEENAGRIAYQRFSSNLDIVGAGSAFGGFRKVKIWDILNLNVGMEADGDLNIQAGATGDIKWGASNITWGGVRNNGNVIVRNRLIMNSGTVGATTHGWALAFANSNLGIWRADNQNYLLGTIDGSSNIVDMKMNGDVVVSRGDFTINNRGSSFIVRPGFRAGVSNASYTEIDTNGGTYFWDSVEINGNMSAVSKNFVIPHPLNSTKKLIHASVEAPRLDLMYSGVVKLEKGKAIVNIDTESCPNSPMSNGTFERLTRNHRVYLQNNQGFTAVKGKVVGGTLEIEAQNNGCDDEIHWLIIAERQDDGIKQSATTDKNGNLTTEQDA